MSRLVLKFGGTSVADPERIARVAKIVADSSRQGKELAVVVSAMGHTTDQLIEMASQITDDPDSRELDVLLSTGEVVSIALLTMALQKMGIRARSFTGPQAGILTDETHNFARIKTVHPTRLESTLSRGEVAVVAGFQGMTRSSEITTLGRGGSDTTAVALAAALKAECCDIYTDVDGVYTTDPRMIKEARRLGAICYEDMLELASMGAQVLNARSVELALKNHVPVRLRSTFAPDDTGTLVTGRELAPDYTICGVALDTQRTLVRITLPADIEPDRFDRFMSEVISNGVSKEDVFLELTEKAEVILNCENRLSKAVAEASSEFLGTQASMLKEYNRVSVVGSGAVSTTDDFAACLQNMGIEIHQMALRDLSVSAMVAAESSQLAMQTLHDRFCPTQAVSQVNVTPYRQPEYELLDFHGELGREVAETPALFSKPTLEIQKPRAGGKSP